MMQKLKFAAQENDVTGNYNRGVGSLKGSLEDSRDQIQGNK